MEACAPSPPRARKLMRVDSASAMSLEFLDDIDGGLASSAVGPPQLYIDQKTVVEEIKDLRALRHGDHLMVGLNCLRRLHWTIDACKLKRTRTHERPTHSPLLTVSRLLFPRALGTVSFLPPLSDGHICGINDAGSNNWSAETVGAGRQRCHDF